MNKKKGWIIAAVGVTVIGLVAAAILWMVPKEETKITYKETAVIQGDLIAGITESGSLTIGTLTQTFDLDTASSGSSGSGGASMGGMSMGGMSTGSSSSSGSSSLVVGEVLVKKGQLIQEGDPIYTLDEESVTDARQALQDAVEDAELSVIEAQIQRDNSLAKAEAEYDLNIAKGQTAKSTYDSTITSLANAVNKAQEALDEASERMEEIPGEIDELEEELEGADDVTKKSLEQQIEALEKELENYQDNYDNLESQLTEAKNNQETRTIEAKSTYDQAILNYQNAKTIYNVAVNGLDDSLTSAKETLEDAETALAEFNQYVLDGTIYAAYSGTAYEVGYAAGDELSSSTSLLVYGDKASVTMDVDVAEEDISMVTVGDTVRVALNAYPDMVFKGTVEEIATSTSSSSTVSYTVTVVVEGDLDLLYSGMTGQVTFVTKELTNVLYVSNKAIIYENGRSYVNMKNGDGTMKRVSVTTGFSNGTYVEIREGLQPGDTVYIESQVSGS